jgi:uncharacterized protein YndB with AHSA1/START domain
MTSATQGVARVHVGAPAEYVYALISDVTRMGDWSPETDNCEWLDGATSAAVGVRFRGANHLGLVKWRTECIITTATPGEEFAFSVMHPDGREETRWGYLLTPTETGTEVVESYEFLWCPLANRILETFIPRDRQLRRGIQQTLTRLAAAAEAAYAASLQRS